jgi:hypothetical protein
MNLKLFDKKISSFKITPLTQTEHTNEMKALKSYLSNHWLFCDAVNWLHTVKKLH